MKYKPDGTIERYKAYLVMQRFFQVPRVDFTKTFIPIIRQESLRIFLAIAALFDLILMQIDVIGAYLKSILGQNKQTIFMKIPQTIQTKQNELVYKIFKSLYCLKQVKKF